MATKLSELLFGAFPDLRYQPTSKRVRADLRGAPVVDTHEALLIWEPKRVTPVFAVPEKDLLARLEPPAQRGEDDEEIIGHPRDPFHRVDVRATLQRVEVKLDDVTLADTSGAQLLYETLLPVRYYIPPEDVRLDLLEASPPHRLPLQGRGQVLELPGIRRRQEHRLGLRLAVY